MHDPQQNIRSTFDKYPLSLCVDGQVSTNILMHWPTLTLFLDNDGQLLQYQEKNSQFVVAWSTLAEPFSYYYNVHVRVEVMSLLHNRTKGKNDSF